MIGVVFVAVYGYRPRWDFGLRALALLLIVNLLLALPNIVLGNDGLLSLSNPVRMLFMLPSRLEAEKGRTGKTHWHTLFSIMGATG